MYKVVIVDDEPTGLKYICSIIAKECPAFQIVGKAENGQQALEQVAACQPELLITDIYMPIMDGIALITRVNELYPDVLILLVSGYSEFEYAKKALKIGVYDYLLKPLIPSDLIKVMGGVEERLKNIRYRKRNDLIKQMGRGERVAVDLLNRYFPTGKYYSAIFRKNGIPKRYSINHSVELFHLEEEEFFSYGRDEREVLYLFSEAVLCHRDLVTVAGKLFDDMQDSTSYWTGIVYTDAFELADFSNIAQKLYRCLNETIIVGENQFILWDACGKERGKADEGTTEQELIKKLEYFLRYKEFATFLDWLKLLFDLWKENQYSQFYIEGKINYLFELSVQAGDMQQDAMSIIYSIEEAFYNSATFHELQKSIVSIFSSCFFSEPGDLHDDKAQLFQSILSFIHAHLDEPLTLYNICHKFGDKVQ